MDNIYKKVKTVNCKFIPIKKVLHTKIKNNLVQTEKEILKKLSWQRKNKNEH